MIQEVYDNYIIFHGNIPVAAPVAPFPFLPFWEAVVAGGGGGGTAVWLLVRRVTRSVILIDTLKMVVGPLELAMVG